MAGNFAVKRTLQSLRTMYYWSGMAFDVSQWCRSCETCGGRRGAPTRPSHALQQDPASELLQCVAIDFLGHLQLATTSDNLYVLVIVDF